MPDLSATQYSTVESITPWQKLLIFALSLRDGRYASVSVPAIFAGRLAELLAAKGYSVRLTDSYTQEQRMLTCWRRQEREETAPAREDS